MRPSSSIPRSLLLGVAILYGAATALYSGCWAFYIRTQQHAQAGFNFERSESRQQTLVTEVAPAGPAQNAGLKAGDNIQEVNHCPLVTLNPFYDAVSRGQPGDRVAFAVRRPGVSSPIAVTVVLGSIPPPRTPPPAQQIASQLLFSYQVPFVVVGLAVLFLRLDSREAWLLALVFGGFIAGSPVLLGEPLIHPALRGFALAYVVAARGMLPALLYYFFATFPASSPIERRVPWLKKVILAASGVIAIPLSLWAWLDGGSRPLSLVNEKVGPIWNDVALACYFFGVIGLALISLVANSLSTPSAEARRKIRVILWGMLCGLGPFLIMEAVTVYTHTEYWTFPFWIWVPTALSLCLVPIAFAYAVVKHRVLEIPVLLKRSARYVLVQRGFIVLLFILAAVTIALFTRFFSQFFQAGSNLGMALSAVFGIVLVWASAPVVKRGTERIDRAFFRSAYDARRILEDLASRSRTATSRSELTGLLEHHVQEALHPGFQLLYLEAGDSELEIERGTVPPELRKFSADIPLLTKVSERAQPYEVPPAEADTTAFSSLPARPECLVPILGREVRLLGLLVLGPRLSEEPYSREDKRLLASAASQSGVALENIGLAEKMAERLEAERRAEQEMEIARQVQSRLLPQQPPSLKTLDCCGKCIQTRAVGGDYYDFLDFGSGRLGLVLADISGKGMSAALLMANLQANLRGQYALALEDMPRLLRSVNHLFYRNTETSHYATMFFGIYDDGTRRLRYVNCGHNAPILMRANGGLERLTATATVLGLFEEWDCAVAECEFALGDVLVIYTDGISEAGPNEDEEFGEERLIAMIRKYQQQSAGETLDNILSDVQKVSRGRQADDMTLIVASCL